MTHVLALCKTKRKTVADVPASMTANKDYIKLPATYKPYLDCIKKGCECKYLEHSESKKRNIKRKELATKCWRIRNGYAYENNNWLNPLLLYSMCLPCER